MSDAHSAAPTNLPPGVEMQDDEHINWGRIGVLAGLALFIFALGTVFALFVLKETQGSLAMDSAPNTFMEKCKADPTECAQVGIVEHRQIELEDRAQIARQVGQERLKTYGWIDRDKNVVHIPVEEGMKKVLAGERP